MNKHEEEKLRIANISAALFADKGFDATRVNEIADASKVNKAMIYYYFKNKEAILDYLIDSFFQDIVSIAADFIHKYVKQMVDDGRLDIKPDCLQFSDEEAIAFFWQNGSIYYDRLIDYMLEHRLIIRILMIESLKKGRHSNGIFRLSGLIEGSDANRIFEMIRETSKNFYYSDDMLAFKFFYLLIPVINFVAYFDEYKSFYTVEEQELRNSFNKLYKIVASSIVSKIR